MEEKIIYFNRQKAFFNILIGVAIFLGILVFVRGIFFLLLFFVAGSFIYFGLKSISKKPQLIISDEGLYIGFKLHKTIAWKKIEKITIKERTVDFRLMKFLELIVKVKTNGPSTVMVREYPIGNLDTSPLEIEKLIKEKLVEKNPDL